MNFWKKKKTNHHHHHHHRENVSDNISIGREEKRREERERERDSRLVRDREKRSRRRRRHIPHVPSHYWREERKREKIFEFVAQKKKKRFPKRLNAKWEKDAHLAPATTSGFCRRSRRFSRGFFLDVLVREPFRGRRASRALPFAHCIKSQSVLRQRQPVSLVLILMSPLLSFFLSCIRIIIRWRYYYFFLSTM